MSANNLIISDKEYLIAERLSQAYMDEMINSAKRYLDIIMLLIEDGINDENIKSALLGLCDPLVRFIYEYGEYDFIDQITFPYLKFNDDIAINKSFDECLRTATYKLLLQLYIDDSSGPNEDIIQKLDQLANQYYEKFNHNKIELNIFFLSNKGLIEMKEIDRSLTDASYYLRFKKTNELLGSPNYPNIKPTFDTVIINIPEKKEK